MIHDHTILAVVPARGGSKAIPLKNLREVGGRSLVAHVGDVIASLPEIDRAVVSTDHEMIAAAAEAAGIAAPFRRSEELSGDLVGDWDILAHALEATEAIDNRRYNIVVMLQPTSPLRSPAEVSAAIQMLVDGGWDSVWTVSPTDSKQHPLKQLIVSEGRLEYYNPQGAKIIARQQLEQVYHRNGVAYVMTRECILHQRTVLGAMAGALVVDGPHVSIDTECDLERIEAIMKQRLSNDYDNKP